MKKNIQINIGGSVFSIDEDAYQLLDRYLTSIKEYLIHSEERDEIIQDIEMRIAELLLEKQASAIHAINIIHVKEVIKVMGQPEDYRLEDENVPEFTSKKNKKLFRDIEDRFIGGVASGLAHYVGIDTVWMRLIWLLIVLAGIGSPILIYIILWILVPEARSTSEKLQMKGKPVNLSNIEKSLKKEYDNVAEKVRNADIKGKTKSFKKKSAIFFDWLLKVGKTLVRVFVFSIGILLLLISFSVILVFIIMLFIPGHGLINSDINFNSMFYDGIDLSASKYWIWKTAYHLSLIIPFIFLFILSLFAINPKMKPAGRLTKTSLLLLWIIAISTTGYFYYSAKVATKYTGSSLQHIELPILAKDTLILKTKQHPMLSHSINRQDYITKTDSLGDYYVYGTNFNITIKPTNEDQPSMVIKKSIKANDINKASSLAENITYNYSLEDNVLQLDDYYLLYNTKQNNKATIRIYLNLPKEMVFSIDSDLAKKSVKQHRNDNLVPEEYLQISGGVINCSGCLEETLKENKPSSDWEKRVEKAFD